VVVDGFDAADVLGAQVRPLVDDAAGGQAGLPCSTPPAPGWPRWRRAAGGALQPERRPSTNHSNSHDHQAIEVIRSNRPLAGQIDLLAPPVA
ncbi:hypothetical protein, partial [Streptomyces sp. NPDC005969]|uniref:hypothetical protein n=1 Tax=Streptomyces sp. NPDC005969 TaxID=3156722 RepID=UPI0033EDF9FE